MAVSRLHWWEEEPTGDVEVTALQATAHPARSLRGVQLPGGGVGFGVVPHGPDKTQWEQVPHGLLHINPASRTIDTSYKEDSVNLEVVNS